MEKAVEEIKMTALEQIENRLAEAQGKRADLQIKLSSLTERAKSGWANYEIAVGRDEPRAKLAELRQELQAIEDDRELVEIKLKQIGKELDNLAVDKTAALAWGHEQELTTAVQTIVDKFTYFEMALTEFNNQKLEIEHSIRDFMNAAARTGRDIHRLRISDNMKRHVIERLYPSLVSRLTAERREQFSRPLADVLEEHVRITLNIPVQSATQTVIETQAAVNN